MSEHFARTRAQLPPELWDAVLDNVRDSSALAACSVVCRDWTFRARRNLLRRVEVASNARKPRRNTMNMPTFCRLFGDASVDARTLVTSLDIGDFAIVDADVTAFLDVLELFCGANVRHLTLRYCCDTHAQTQLYDVCRLAFSAVTSLDLSWTFHAVSEFSALASQFPCLQVFVVRCLVFRDSDHGLDLIRQPLFSQCSLRFELPSTFNLLTRWAAICISRLSEIWVCLEDFTCEILCNICIRDPSVLPRVKSLAFVLDGHEPEAHYDWDSLPDRLQQCTQLEELVFTFAAGRYRHPLAMLLDRLRTIFRFPPSVKRIIIDGDLYGGTGSRWAELGAIFETMFPLLEAMPAPIVQACPEKYGGAEEKQDSESMDDEDFHAQYLRGYA